MELLGASTPKGDGSFLHIGYMSVNNGPMRNQDTDHGGFAYLLDDISLQVSRPARRIGDMVDPRDGYFSLGLEPAWQAPAGHGQLFGVSIPVENALAIPELSADSELAASLTEPARPLIRTESFTIPAGSEAGNIAQAGPGIAILLSFVAGITLLLLYKHVLARENRRAYVHLLGGLFLAVVVPTVLALQNSARAGELERQARAREMYTLQASALVNTPVYWDEQHAWMPEPWEEITPVRYEHPELATMVLMHAIIGHGLYYLNDEVDSLGELQPVVSLPGVKEYTPGMKYALRYYGLDGWGREFRLSSRELVPDEEYARRDSGWLTTLQSAGADGAFDTDDDFILTTHQRAKQMYEGGLFKQAYNHYAAYIAPVESGLRAYLPGYVKARATRYQIPPYYSVKRVEPSSEGNQIKGQLGDYNAALALIRADYERGGAEGLALHLYGISREQLGEEYHDQYR